MNVSKIKNNIPFIRYTPNHHAICVHRPSIAVFFKLLFRDTLLDLEKC